MSNENKQVIANIGMYYASYQLSRYGWNVIPTSRNAKGVDIIVYSEDAQRYMGIQVKTKTKGKVSDVPFAKQPTIENTLADYWVISYIEDNNTLTSYILSKQEVIDYAVPPVNPEKSKHNNWFLCLNAPKHTKNPNKIVPFGTDEFKERWDKIK